MERVELTGVPGVRWVPDVATGVGALVLAGSSGRVDSARAELLARQGAVAESIQWFGGPGQHAGPWEIPIELFLDRVEDLAKSCERVIAVGASFGSEAALLTGAHSPRVSAVVGFAPSDVVWAGVTRDGRTTSHWTLNGKPVPYVPFVPDWQPETDPPSFVDLYRESRRRFAQHVADATIPVERIPDVVLIAGGDDHVWPAVIHTDAIASRRRRHGMNTVVVTDPEAGHRTLLPGETVVTSGMRMKRGGTRDADRRLGATAWPHITALL